jgi:integrase
MLRGGNWKSINGGMGRLIRRFSRSTHTKPIPMVATLPLSALLSTRFSLLNTIHNDSAAPTYVRPDRKIFTPALGLRVPVILLYATLGIRMDEANRLLRTDPNFETEMIHIPGTRTDEANCYLPMSPALQGELKASIGSPTDDLPYLFPGRSAQPRGKKIYSRPRLFEKIQRGRAFKAYIEKNPINDVHESLEGAKATRLSWRLTTKQLRDYFGTQVSAQVSDPNTVKELIRHTTSLRTTSRYMRTAPDRLKESVENLEATSGGQFPA